MSRIEKLGRSRLAGWMALWAAFLAICLLAAFATRMSYTDFSSDRTALMGLRYEYAPYDSAEVRAAIESDPNIQSPLEMMESSELIVECEFGGERAYSYQTFLSTVEVLQVIKGDPALAGQELSVYEPVKIVERDIGVYSAEDQSALRRRFGDRGSMYQLESYGAYLFGVPMMVENGRYILFLERRQYPDAKDVSAQQTEYVLLDSPYSKVSSSGQSPEAFDLAPDLITLAESSSYDILAHDEASIRDYENERSQLMVMLEKRFGYYGEV